MAPKILVVDDEPDLEYLIKQKFRKEIKNNTYEFKFAHNGLQALEKLSEDKNIELVLTDINMPEMDGLTLLKKMKELNNPLLWSVIVSAYGDIANIRTAMNGGAFDFVVKPIDLTDLEITIKKVLENLKTFKEAFKSRDKLLIVQQELKEARALQLSMLPKNLPAVPYLDIAVYMKTATEVGGDYYDFSINKDDSLNVVIGDATGHGMKAGTMVSVMKALFTSDSEKMGIADFFTSSNRTIKQINLERIMMAFAMIKIHDNKISAANAGMPSIYIYKNSKNEIEELEFQSMPLGAMTDSIFEVKHSSLESGDTILLMSDGLPELMNGDQELFGYNRVIEIFKEVAVKESAEIINYLKDESSRWTNGKDPDDDLTFVVIKKK